MATYRNKNDEADLFERVRRYISGLGLYTKPAGGIPASDLANYVLPSAVTDYSVGRLNYTKNLGTVTTIKMNNAVVPQTDGVVDLGAIQEKIDTNHKISGDFIIDGQTNKVINVKPDWNAASDDDAEILNKPTLATVATSGSYNDLTNKPDIPSEQIQSDWNQSNTSAKDFIKNKPEIPALPTLADVATSGDYDDLSNKPTIPSAVTESTVSGWGFTKNAGTITGITMNGASKGTSGVVDLGTVITSHQSLSDYVQKSQTSGLLKNDGTVDTTAYTTNTGTVTSTGGTVTVNNIQVVSALPASPDANTLYLIPES